jgi:hypothetical protein
LEGLKAVVKQFHARGVRVGFPYNPWDTGTSPLNETDDFSIARFSAEVGADFWNGDTLACVPEAFWSSSLAAGCPVAFQPEGGVTARSLAWTKLSWGENGGWQAAKPPVSLYKWLELRHTSQLVARFSTDHVALLTEAFFNGIGFVPWENVWGFWNGISERDGELTRRFGILSRFLAPFLVSPAWEPYTALSSEAEAAGVYASAWPSPPGVSFPSASTAWTIVNSNRGLNFSGPILSVPCDSSPTMAYFDMYAGVELTPVADATSGACVLKLSVEAGCIGAIISAFSVDVQGNGTFTDALNEMQVLTTRSLASYPTAFFVLPQAMAVNVGTAPTPPSASGMVLIPNNSSWLFNVTSCTPAPKSKAMTTLRAAMFNFPGKRLQTGSTSNASTCTRF